MSVIIYQSQLQGTGTRYLLSNYLRGNWRCITYKRKASPFICDVILFCHKLLQSPGLNLSLCKLRKGTYKVRSMISLKFNKIKSSIHVTTHRRAFRSSTECRYRLPPRPPPLMKPSTESQAHLDKNSFSFWP